MRIRLALHGMSALMRQFMAGQLKYARDLTWFLAPYVNSYKRFQVGTFAPTKAIWSRDNRTAGFRLCGENTNGIRIECRIGGADLNPYLAFAALLAAGLAGIDENLTLEPAFIGDAYSGKGVREIQMAQHNTAQRSSDPIPPPDKIPISLGINGVETTLRVAPWTTLLDALRDHLELTGTKKGCDHGQCGACTVLVDGRRVNSCLTLAVMKDGAKVTTVEGLATKEALHPLQQAFIDHDAFQCGYCTPGQICSAAGLIAEGKASSADLVAKPLLSMAELRERMSGNICRCGAYSNIVDAITEVAGGAA